MKILVSFVLLCLISRIQCDLNWWRTANVYQIYPRSFKDSDGDGIGDLNGITQMLPYLKDLGIDAFWMSPIFKSPMKDFGYDISDFRDIQLEYGTMEDFDRLLKTAHELDLRVILDFVPNHSSDEHEWFLKSVAGDPEYKDFYVWHPGKEDPANPQNRLPPSNWLSAFRGSAWKWHETRGEFYLHAFAYQQPDLNYRNEKVVEAMKDILRFWLEKGVDGFRIDAVPNLFEVEPIDGQYPDEVKSGYTDDPEESAYLYHNLTMDLPETVEMVYQWRDVVDRFSINGNTRIMLTEAYSHIDILMQYYGNGVKNGSHAPFNFYMIMNLNNDSNAIDFHRNIQLWLDKLPNGSVANWVMGNHDQRRIGSRFGTHRIDLINMIIKTLPGISITYNGEEIGMTDVYISWEDSVDPAGCNSNPEIFDKFSRDPARTPFQWDSSTSAGFSVNPKPWLPVSPLYKEVNVKVQQTAPRSHLKIYRRLLQLRRTETLQKGSVETRTHGQNVLSITRRLPGRDTYITVANIGPKRESIDLREVFSGRLIFHIVSVDSKKRDGDGVMGPNLELAPYEAFILRGPVKI
ncbi:maltase A3-like [Lutzomyia longipalpis]|uniref:maltase A3-like n=1 Tax=Lutzomyia longipalpis TaxID=7200 RepID=UPI002483E0DB|nr:maltase A3-like [Lutzomyia longipalpis]